MAITSYTWLPGRCALCGRSSDRELDLCLPCERDLPVLGRACRQCAIPLPVSFASELHCGACLRRSPPQNATRAAFRYAYPLDALVQQFKFRADTAAGRVLGKLFTQHLHPSADVAPVLMPVPLHSRRLRERGFNQAELLARDLAAANGWRMRDDLVERCRETAVQSGMDAAARRRNVRGAFALTQQTVPSCIVIIDDVVTTGSTTAEIAVLLLRAGAKRVEVWALARTV